LEDADDFQLLVGDQALQLAILALEDQAEVDGSEVATLER
jgi:hypothetical protein